MQVFEIKNSFSRFSILRIRTFDKNQGIIMITKKPEQKNTS